MLCPAGEESFEFVTLNIDTPPFSWGLMILFRQLAIFLKTIPDSNAGDICLGLPFHCLFFLRHSIAVVTAVLASRQGAGNNQAGRDEEQRNGCIWEGLDDMVTYCTLMTDLGKPT